MYIYLYLYLYKYEIYIFKYIQFILAIYFALAAIKRKLKLYVNGNIYFYSFLLYFILLNIFIQFANQNTHLGYLGLTK